MTLSVNQFMAILAREAAPYESIDMAMLSVKALGKVTRKDSALEAIRDLHDLVANDMLSDDDIIALANDIAKLA